VDALEFLEVMLGDQPPLDPEETFYQRALAGDLDALAEQSERALREAPAEAYLDSVAVPALRLAQADAHRQALAPERLEQLRASVLTLLEDLDAAEPPTEEGAAPMRGPPPPGWAEPGAVLCLGGRGPFDALLAAMLAQILTWRGYGVQQAPVGGALPAVPPRLAIICLMEGGSSAAAGRYLLRRTRRRLPGVACIALVWQGEAAGEDRLAAALRAEAGTPPLPMATALAEAVDLVAETASAAAVVPALVGQAQPERRLPAQGGDQGGNQAGNLAGGLAGDPAPA
jgi:hypothetical protein